MIAWAYQRTVRKYFMLVRLRYLQKNSLVHWEFLGIVYLCGWSISFTIQKTGIYHLEMDSIALYTNGDFSMLRYIKAFTVSRVRFIQIQFYLLLPWFVAVLLEIK